METAPLTPVAEPTREPVAAALQGPPTSRRASARDEAPARARAALAFGPHHPDPSRLRPVARAAPIAPAAVERRLLGGRHDRDAREAAARARDAEAFKGGMTVKEINAAFGERAGELKKPAKRLGLIDMGLIHLFMM